MRHLQDYENIFLNRFVGDCIYFETLILHDIQYNMSKQENVYSLGTWALLMGLRRRGNTGYKQNKR